MPLITAPPPASPVAPPPGPRTESAPAPATTAASPPRAPAPRVRSPWRARAIALAVILLIGAGIAYALRPTPMIVESARAHGSTLRVTVDADALTRVRAHFTVAAPVTGLVQRLALREGDLVRAGQVIAWVATPPAHPTERQAAEARLNAALAAQRQADARLAQAGTVLAQAEREAGRVRTLAAAGALADRDVETASVTVDARRADLTAARAQVTVARADVTQARAALDAMSLTGGVSAPVRAPASGRVLRVPDQSARVVAAGTPLLELGDTGALEVVADVLSTDAANIRVGQAVELRGWGGSPLHGVVRLVEPSARTRISALGVEEQRLAVVIDMADAPPSLGDGFRLDASIVTWEGRNVLSIPASALLRTDEKWQVYVMNDGRARRRDVRIGHIGGGLAEVTGGLTAGDEVIVFPAEALREGTRVKTEKE